MLRPDNEEDKIMGPQRIVNTGDRVIAEVPASEACVHLGVAGSRMQVELTADGMAQLCTLDGKPYNFPVTPGEAGLYWDEQAARYYAYPTPGTVVQLLVQVPAHVAGDKAQLRRLTRAAQELADKAWPAAAPEDGG